MQHISNYTTYEILCGAPYNIQLQPSIEAVCYRKEVSKLI